MRSGYGSATLKYDIAATLVAARKMRNLTQAALANIAGLSQAYIIKLESGEANPTVGRIGVGCLKSASRVEFSCPEFGPR
jgi:predicted transcriptional regulator